MSNPIFEKNIQALLQANTPLATKLFAIDTNERYDVTQGEDPVDINIFDTEEKVLLYQNPVQEVIDYIENNKELERYPFRYFFGAGNGILLKMLLNSAYLKRIVVIEPEIEMLYIVFNMLDFSDAILEHRIEFDTASEIDFVRAIHYVGHNEGKIYLKIFKLEIANAYYENYFTQSLEKVHTTFLKAIKHNIVSHGNDIIDSLMGVEHHFQNLPTMINNPPFTSLLQKKNSNIAIVVSTGPSLTKQLPLLKKVQDYVTIISVDASFPILVKNGIKPDIVTVLERIPETANFFKDVPAELQKDVIFLLVSIAHQDVVDAISGTKVLVMRPHEYTQYFELNTFGYLGSGMSAANLAHEVAIAMEYPQCVLIGQDLAFGDDGTSHADNHFFGVNEEDSEKFNIFTTRYGGEGKIKTTLYWNLFREFFEKLIVQTSNVTQTINATEGGARIQGAIELSFKDVVTQFVKMDKKKATIELQSSSAKEQEAYRKQILEKTHHILESAREKQHHIEEVFLKIQTASEDLVKLKDEKKLEEINFEYLASLVEEIDTIKLFIDDKEFTKMFYDVMRSTLIHQELNIAILQVRPVKTDLEKKAKMIEWIMVHRYWLFLFAGAINSQREIMVRAIEKWPEEMKRSLALDDEIEDLKRSSRELSVESKK